MTDLQKSKLSSRAFWIVMWSMLVLTAWGTLSLLTDVAPAWMSGVMLALGAIPASYVAITRIKKPKAGEK